MKKFRAFIKKGEDNFFFESNKIQDIKKIVENRLFENADEKSVYVYDNGSYKQLFRDIGKRIGF